MDTATVLIVEDDGEIRSLLIDLLNRNGYLAEGVDGGVALDRRLRAGMPDLIVLDIMLPGEDGLSICRRLRARSGVPILMLTARWDEVDRIVGLEIGADDYLGKPFNPREFLARVRAILRRAKLTRDSATEARRRKRVGGLLIDIDARTVTDPAGAPVKLTTAEFDLLLCFLDRPRRVLSRDQLLDWTRGRNADPFDRAVDVTVSRLRAKLAACLGPDASPITTVRNAGYLFAVDVEDA
ncbi:response regulator [Aquabacter spiritensis]|uniref:Regulatory protein VirG n=1 Tax=Aquabacter spiritensis TaxID=933073 RepID=A0A4R3LUQ7_9HYPH|nr:response regulator transcription factor [Aquabacter spiritensis]TCT04254.1 two-component system OmpR family response regulator [Aquabacter spiritensis]